LEAWLDELIEAVGRPGLVVVDASANLILQDNPPPLPGTEAKVAGGNPHTWLDPVISQQQVRTILTALRQADPGNAAVYEANAKTYLARLQELDHEFQTVLEPLPAKNLVTFHDAFPYLAARYGLHYVGCVSEFPEKDPSPAKLGALIDAIRKANAHILFAESGYAPELLHRIAEQTGANVSQLDTLEIGEGDAAAYLNRMRANLAALKTAFARPEGP
jgi:zinc transport system substrate-binding protein